MTAGSVTGVGEFAMFGPRERAEPRGSQLLLAKAMTLPRVAGAVG